MRNTILLGVVGSHAYGMANENSDVDRAGVFMAPTRSWLSLERPETKYETKNPDHIEHELWHFCHLALHSNPHMLELLWLSEYETLTPTGVELVDGRRNFASAYWVKQAYLGYAKEQYRRMLRGTDARPEKRAKNARHMLRLLNQGQQLYTTGKLTVKLADPQRYLVFGEAAAKDPRVAANALAAAERDFAKRSPLPEEPDKDVVDRWLVQVRVRQLEEERGADGAPT